MQHFIDIIIGIIKPIPSGTIILWSSTAGTIPTGWVQCNGTQGTPDLRAKFVIGAGSGYPFGSTGGSTTHTHPTGKGSVQGTGIDRTGDNVPPYHALWYIMKL